MPNFQPDVLNPRVLICGCLLYLTINSKTGILVSNCGFFKHPVDRNYDASPDGITQLFSVEVRNRAENSTAPLENVNGSDVVQTNFQMSCTGGKITFL